MKIGIIGAGAIGMIFGAYLAEAKHDIVFYVRKENENLYIEKEPNSPELIRCKQVSVIESLFSMDLIIIAVKYHHLKNLKSELDLLPRHIPLLFLQNGLLHLSYTDQLKQETIVIGSVLLGATKVNSFTVRHLGIGKTSVGVYRGVWENADVFFKSSSNNFPLVYSNQIKTTLVKKALMNCLINPLSTITKSPNGMLIKNESYQLIMKNMYVEIMNVFNEWNELLLWEEVVELCKNTENNRSSMLADFENNRIMEIDTIVGAILDEAKKRNEVLPILNTFYLLLKEMNKVGNRHE
ncbi:2-dehydropantoate 2-reductase [Psychrobacillus sp. FJAT-51614]|uniref:2-dehydropantoate 2-reductase n=1 Tax=Psychrobacillus mangrovi TaxID=3117745 RepID=A0ABU8FAV2_9BACI